MYIERVLFVHSGYVNDVGGMLVPLDHSCRRFIDAIVVIVIIIVVGSIVIPQLSSYSLVQRNAAASQLACQTTTNQAHAVASEERKKCIWALSYRIGTYSSMRNIYSGRNTYLCR
jgi:hypothetical protein